MTVYIIMSYVETSDVGGPNYVDNSGIGFLDKEQAEKEADRMTQEQPTKHKYGKMYYYVEEVEIKS